MVTLEPTCTAKGKRDVYCSKCLKYLRTEDIAATGHDLQVIQTDDQSEKNGHIFEYLRCAKCNDESTDTIRTTHVRDEDGNYVWKDGCYTDMVLTEPGSYHHRATDPPLHGGGTHQEQQMHRTAIYQHSRTGSYGKGVDGGGTCHLYHGWSKDRCVHRVSPKHCREYSCRARLSVHGG